MRGREGEGGRERENARGAAAGDGFFFSPSPSPSLDPHRSLHFHDTQIGLLAAFGGGIVTALLLQDPATAPIALLADNAVGVCYTAAWWALLYSPAPFRSSLRSALALPPVRALGRACTNALRAGLVVARVDAACRRFPGVVAAPLLLGTLAGCAGKVLTDVAFLSPALTAVTTGRGARSPSSSSSFRTEFAVPGLAMRSAAAGAALYWGAVHVYRALSPAEGAALVALLFVGHGLAVDALAAATAGGPPRPLDYTAAPAAALHWVAGVPVPGGGGSGAGVGAGRARAAKKRA